MGRYVCGKGKLVTISKANKFCLIKRCNHLQVQYKKGKFKTVVPISMLEIKGC